MKELYAGILFDDGKAPKAFHKDHLEVERKDINDLIKKDVRLSSRNMRNMGGSGVGSPLKTTVQEQKPKPEPKPEIKKIVNFQESEPTEEEFKHSRKASSQL